jgi:hypothetical protein
MLIVPRVPQKALPGTFDWLVKIFKQHRTWSEIDRKTQRMYEQGLNLVGDHILKDGTRVGSKLLLSLPGGSSTHCTPRFLL